LISFHFYDIDSKMFTTAITNIDDEDYEWFVRNYRLSISLKHKQERFSEFSELIAKEFKKTDRFYRNSTNNSINYFLKKDRNEAVLMKIQ
jgi:hypothetical protein